MQARTLNQDQFTIHCSSLFFLSKLILNAKMVNELSSSTRTFKKKGIEYISIDATFNIYVNNVHLINA